MILPENNALYAPPASRQNTPALFSPVPFSQVNGDSIKFADVHRVAP